jgi:hypothetical protein
MSADKAGIAEHPRIKSTANSFLANDAQHSQASECAEQEQGEQEQAYELAEAYTTHQFLDTDGQAQDYRDERQ